MRKLLTTTICNIVCFNSVVFWLLFTACTVSKPTTINGNVLYDNYKDPGKNEEPSYLLIKDSSRVYGNKIKTNYKAVSIDGKEFPISEVIGFQNKEGFWKKVEEHVMARTIIKGRISVYRHMVTRYSGNNTPYTVTTIYYFKNNEPQPIMTFENLQQLVKDCPKAYDMINISYHQYVEEARKNRYFTQAIIETYNACGEWK